MLLFGDEIGYVNLFSSAISEGFPLNDILRKRC